MRDDYAWDRTGERDAFVDEMEALLGAFDVQPRVAEGVAIAREVARPRSRSAVRRHAFVIAAAAALVLTLVAIAARGREARVMDRSFGAIEIPMSDPPVSIDPVPPEAAPRLPALAPLPPLTEERARPRRARVAPLAAAPERDPREVQRENAAKIGQQLRRYGSMLERCVAEGRKKKAYDKGYFWLAFTVTAEGTTTNVHTSASRPYAPDVEACCVAAARTWTFTDTSTIGPEGHEVRLTVRLYE
jgi:hypothetical protein